MKFPAAVIALAVTNFIGLVKPHASHGKLEKKNNVFRNQNAWQPGSNNPKSAISFRDTVFVNMLSCLTAGDKSSITVKSKWTVGICLFVVFSFPVTAKEASATDIFIATSLFMVNKTKSTMDEI